MNSLGQYIYNVSVHIAGITETFYPESAFVFLRH